MLTVALATHNGARTLPETLQSFVGLASPPGGWKLIVVDNASTDETAAVLRQYGDSLPLTVLQQPIRGKNHALNLAVASLQGELIVFTDDDVVVPSDWLQKYAELAKTHTGCSVFGGKVLPRWPGAPPREIIEAIPLGPAFAVHPFGMRDGPINPGMIWGPNMAVRKGVFDDGHRFDDNIGPAAGNYVMGSEVEFTHRLAAAGYQNWFATDITVQHQVRPEQLSEQWLQGRARRFGRRAALVTLESGAVELKTLLGLPRWRVRKMIQAYLQLNAFTILPAKSRKLRALWEFNLHKAALDDLRRQPLPHKHPRR